MQHHSKNGGIAQAGARLWEGRELASGLGEAGHDLVNECNRDFATVSQQNTGKN
jgi:hypothetical protein